MSKLHDISDVRGWIRDSIAEGHGPVSWRDARAVLLDDDAESGVADAARRIGPVRFMKMWRLEVRKRESALAKAAKK